MTTSSLSAPVVTFLRRHFCGVSMNILFPGKRSDTDILDRVWNRLEHFADDNDLAIVPDSEITELIISSSKIERIVDKAYWRRVRRKVLEILRTEDRRIRPLITTLVLCASIDFEGRHNKRKRVRTKAANC